MPPTNERSDPSAPTGLHPVHFEHTFPVELSDIDERGHVNNTVYLRWVQDVAAAHWRAAAEPGQYQAIAWVAVRHEIDYKHPALPGDRILARTWVGEAVGARFERHTELLRATDRRVLARARTLWCPVDAGSGRPRRITAELRDRFYRPGRGETG